MTAPVADKGTRAAAPTGSGGPVNTTVAWLGLRSLFGRRRGVLLVVLPVVLLALAVLVRVLVDGSAGAPDLLHQLGLVVVVPLVALIATTGVLSSEIDDGSVVYLLAKPLSRLTIVVSKLLVASGCVLVFAAAPLLVAGLVLRPDAPRLALGFAVGGLAGGLTYCALFALASVLTRHAVVVGLVYVLIWEGLLGGLLDGIRWLSVTWWSAAITDEITGGPALVEKMSLTYAVAATVVVVLGASWLASHRLRGYNYTADE
ncbi:ABC-2 type transport system permease protein [Friedmanniella luteola]|uniref:ABC-2 type transport system permease protein n=1 Tax=Friedmanniella luteola TaxID=546871 RepID=A0A1H1ZQE0_9ACTN|nr:ABC transporter permease subunit [Friedmanniella luteola]SDT35914.1 ABC-2 type transport system permease protein [Friedmanniella luteola]